MPAQAVQVQKDCQLGLDLTKRVKHCEISVTNVCLEGGEGLVCRGHPILAGTAEPVSRYGQSAPSGEPGGSDLMRSRPSNLAS